MPFDDLRLMRGLNGRGLPFPYYGANAAADVARAAETRHDAESCCGERQETDVGEGWRLLGADEVLQEGDQCDVGANEPCWVNTVCVGDRAGDGCVGGGCDRYRRRVTPPAPELSPDAVSAMCQRNERDALLKKIATLRSEAEQQQEIILHAGLEVERLGNACEAYTTEIVRLRSEVERLRRAANSWERESVAHAEEVERLRLTLDEREALAWCRDVIPAMACKSAVIARIHAACCGKMLTRLGGGEGVYCVAFWLFSSAC